MPAYIKLRNKIKDLEVEDMRKLFILESKGEIMGVLTHENKSYIEFKSEIEEIAKEGDVDFHTIKGILTSLYGYELMEIVASAEVTKRKGGF